MGTTALVLPDSPTALRGIDPLSQPATATVAAAKLRPGMVLVDLELGTPAAVVDHRISSRAGLVRFLVLDLDTDRWIEQVFSRSAELRVVAA